MFKCLDVVTKNRGKCSILFITEKDNLEIRIMTPESEAKIEIDPNTALHVYDCIQEYFGEIIKPKVTMEDAAIFRRFDWLHLSVED